jgi:hypothetical protein
MLTKLFDKLRSNESGTANYNDFHDSPFLSRHFQAAGLTREDRTAHGFVTMLIRRFQMMCDQQRIGWPAIPSHRRSITRRAAVRASIELFDALFHHEIQYLWDTPLTSTAFQEAPH